MNADNIQSRWGDAVQNFGALLAEIQPFLARASEIPVQTAADLRRDAAGRIRTAEKRLRSLQEAAEDAVESRDQYVRQNAWAAIAGGALVGLAAGVALSHYRRKADPVDRSVGSDPPRTDNPIP